MKETWGRIETWLGSNASLLLDSLCPGATVSEIAELERALGVVLPDDVRESYGIHNGQSDDGPGLIDTWEFLSLDRILAEWRIWKDLLDSGTFAESRGKPVGPIRDDWWNPRWIPVTYSGSGDHHSIDLDPAPGGAAGQIITMWHDDADRRVIAANWSEWFERFADALEGGQYVYSEDDFGLVDRDDL
jgi:cell wall assembly regulator SMI1